MASNINNNGNEAWKNQKKESNLDNIEESHFFLFQTNVKAKNPIKIMFEKIKDYDKPHNELIENNIINDSNSFYQSRQNFIEDSFYNSILFTKEKIKNFPDIYKDIKFGMLKNQDRTHSSIMYYCQVYKDLQNNQEFKNREDKIKKIIDNLDNYQKNNLIISDKYRSLDNKNDFSFYRKVRPNGNSFYISFMYQYIKKLIQDNNTSSIANIFNIEKQLHVVYGQINNNDNNQELGKNYDDNNEVQDSNRNNKNNNNNLLIAFIYLSIIYNYTCNKNIEEAVKILYNSFAYEESFSFLLCCFMKFQIQEFIRINKYNFNYKILFEDNKLIKEEYFNPEDKSFLYEKYIKENLDIKLDKMEPSLFIISIVPYVFNVNMNIYINEQSYSKKPNQPLCNKIILNKNNNIEINILYSSFSYHIIDKETEQGYIHDNREIGNIFNLPDNSILNYKNEENIMFVEKKNEECCCNNNNCNCTKFFIFKNIEKFKNHSICLNCFKNKIKEIFTQRYNYMIQEKFKYIEFYLRDIILFSDNSNNYIYMSSNEFFFIFNCNIFTYFRQLISNICDKCGQLQKDKIIKKTCRCKRCINCAKKEVKYIFLNKFEKENIYKNKLIKCECGKDEKEVDYLSEILNLIDEEEKKILETEAKQRIKDYYNKYCMICGEEINKNNNNKCEKYENIEHYICEKCNKKNEINYCKLCQKYHDKSLNNISGNIVQNSNNDLKNSFSQKQSSNSFNNNSSDDKKISVNKSNNNNINNNQPKLKQNNPKISKNKEDIKDNKIEDDYFPDKKIKKKSRNSSVSINNKINKKISYEEKENNNNIKNNISNMSQETSKEEEKNSENKSKIRKRESNICYCGACIIF